MGAEYCWLLQVAKGKREGSGQYLYDNGDLFDGAWKADKPGVGQMTVGKDKVTQNDD